MKYTVEEERHIQKMMVEHNMSREEVEACIKPGLEIEYTPRVPAVGDLDLHWIMGHRPKSQATDQVTKSDGGPS